MEPALSRRAFIGVLGRVGAALGVMPPGALKVLSASVESAGTAPVITALSGLLSGYDQFEKSARALHHLAVWAFEPEAALQGIPSPELFAFKAADQLRQVFVTGGLLEPSPTQRQELRPYFDPRFYPDLEHTLPQRARGIKTYMIMTMPPIGNVNGGSSEFYLSQYAGVEYGNEPNAEQARAWEQFRQKREGLFQLLQAGKTPAGMQALSARGCKLLCREAHENGLDFAVQTIFQSLWAQEFSRASLLSALSNPQRFRGSRGWEFLRVLEDPSLAPRLMADPQFVLRAQFERSIHEISPAFQYNQEINANALRRFKRLALKLKEHGIEIPPEYRPMVSELFQRYPDRSSAQPSPMDLFELLEIDRADTHSLWHPTQGMLSARVWKSSHNPSPLVTVSLVDQGWRASFKPRQR